MADRVDRRASGTTLIGLDGVAWELLDDLIENAEVPTLASLVEGSVDGVTKSTVPCLTCPALPSFYTGMNAGNLGIFDFVKPDGSLVDYRDVTEPAVWDYLGTLDVSMVVGAMRTTHPAPEINGVFVSDVLSTVEEPDFVSPGSAREYGERFHRLRERLEREKKGTDADALLETFVRMNDERAEVFLDLLDREEPAFALLWFGLADGVQHYFWDDRPRLYRFFEAFDGKLDRLLDAREGTNVVVMGDHGFGPATEHQFHLNEALRRAGYLRLSGGPVRGALTELSYALSERYVSDRWKRLALEVVNRLRKDEPDDAGHDPSRTVVVTPLDTLPGIDWSRTVAHVSTRKGWGVNLVRENVEGEYEAVRDELLGALEAIEAPDGAPAIKGAWRGEEVYWGAYGDQVPDIVFLADDRLRVRPSLVGSLFSEVRGPTRPGHESARDAIFLASGPDVDGSVGSVGDVQIYDVVPTLLSLLGVPIPETLDGTPVDLLGADAEAAPVTDAYPVERYRVRKALPRVRERDGVRL